jgi:hypothetical protein
MTTRTPLWSKSYPTTQSSMSSNSSQFNSIVALHGLGARPEYAWVWLPKNNPPGRNTPDQPYNWLKHLLPTELCCRVLAFNYESRWHRDAPQQRLPSISDTLLNALRSKREDTNVGLPLTLAKRPILTTPSCLKDHRETHNLYWTQFRRHHHQAGMHYI